VGDVASSSVLLVTGEGVVISGFADDVNFIVPQHGKLAYFVHGMDGEQMPS